MTMTLPKSRYHLGRIAWRYPQKEDRLAWLVQRRQIIGSSDAPILTGDSPWSSPYALWADKRGLIPMRVDSPSEAATWGTILEPVVAKHWAEDTGRRVFRERAIVVHPHWLWMGADVDYLTRTDQGYAVVEVKTTSERYAGRFHGDIPDSHWIQIQHQLAVTQAPLAFHVMLIGGQHLSTTEILPDVEFQHYLIDLESTFWQHVVEGTPPPLEGHPSDLDALGYQWQPAPAEAVAVWQENDPESVHWIQAYFDAVSQAKEAERTKDAAKAYFAERLIRHQANKGLCSDAHGATHTITFKPSTRTQWDVKALDRDHPELAATYRRTTVGDPTVRIY